MNDADGLVGAVFAGCRIERLLGRGGMGAVYLGRDAQGEPRALKFLAAEVAENPKLRRRFQREGDALRKVPPHPNVVRVFGAHEDDLLDQPYLVMEFLEGEALDEVVSARGPLPPEEAVGLALQAARGLQALHRCGLIHRDVKPTNLMALADGGVKVVDLGLAKDLFSSGLTEPGRVIGTLRYMAPEQWSGAPACEGSDVFGLGATLYYLLTGRAPFEGNVQELQEQCVSGSFPPVAELAPAVSAPLAAVVHRMLHPDLAERYARVHEAAADLQRALEGVAAQGVPHLLDVEGRRFTLAGERRFTIGSEAGQAIRLEHPSVSPRHARLGRKAEGFVLRDLRSEQGTWVNEERVVDRPLPVPPGARLRFGEVVLEFREPGAGQASYLSDVQRGVCPAPLLWALVEAGDPRTLLFLIECLSPDPLHAQSAARLGASTPELDAGAARAQAKRAAGAHERLRAITGLDLGADPNHWLAWWYTARLDQPLQLSPLAPTRAFRVQTATSDPVACGDVTLIGRDPRCHLVLEQPAAPRRFATLVRLHERLLVHLEGGPTALLAPGSSNLVGLAIELEVSDPGLVLDPFRFNHLAQAGNPATLATLLAWAEGGGSEGSTTLGGVPPAVLAEAQASAARRAALAEELLAKTLGPRGSRPWRAVAAGRELGVQARVFG